MGVPLGLVVLPIILILIPQTVVLFLFSRFALGYVAAFLAVLDRYTRADLLGGAEGDEVARLLGLFPPAAAAGVPEPEGA